MGQVEQKSRTAAQLAQEQLKQQVAKAESMLGLLVRLGGGCGSEVVAVVVRQRSGSEEQQGETVVGREQAVSAIGQADS